MDVPVHSDLQKGGCLIATEKRLIDANAMREDWLENGENEYVYDTNAVLASIDAQPTVDAVEVVRCKDCKHWLHLEDGIGDCTNGRFHIHGVADITMNAEEFCCLGERRADD